MKLFIDTTQKNFACSLFDDDFNIIKKSIIETKYKVEEIINFFDSIEQVNKINEYFINLGPGSFTGSRIALVYIRTISQINKSKIFVSDSFKLLKKINNLNEPIFINANKNNSYCLNNNTITIQPKSEENEIDYEKLIANFRKYLSCFTIACVDSLKPIYASNPSIGQIKELK